MRHSGEGATTCATAPSADPGAGGEDVVIAEFPPTPAAATAARRLVTELLSSWGFPPASLDAGAMVVTELASNAVRHARSPFTVRVQQLKGGVRVTVRDQSDRRAVRQPTDLDAEGGRGLSIVAAVATAWGCELHADGKEVWADLPASL